MINSFNYGTLTLTSRIYYTMYRESIVQKNFYVDISEEISVLRSPDSKQEA